MFKIITSCILCLVITFPAYAIIFLIEFCVNFLKTFLISIFGLGFVATIFSLISFVIYTLGISAIFTIFTITSTSYVLHKFLKWEVSLKPMLVFLGLYHLVTMYFAITQSMPRTGPSFEFWSFPHIISIACFFAGCYLPIFLSYNGYDNKGYWKSY